MGKYMNGLTSAEVCKLEVEEATDIMKSYNMKAADIDTIKSMIEEAYYQIGELCKCGRSLEAILLDKGFKPTDYFQEYIQKIAQLNAEEKQIPADDKGILGMDCMSR